MLRNIHLLLGLFCSCFVLMYGLSSMQMSHNSWFPNKPAVSESQSMLPPNLDARAAARILMDQGLRGEIAQVKAAADSIQFRIQRPGTVYEVAYNPQSGNAQVKTNTAGLMGMLNRLHHINGFWHDYGLINMWSAALLFTSLALVCLSLTGIYLWFKIYKERLIGGVLLGLSLSYGLCLIFLMRNAS